MSDMLARLAARAQESPVVLGRRIGYRFAPAADHQEAWPGEEVWLGEQKIARPGEPAPLPWQADRGEAIGEASAGARTVETQVPGDSAAPPRAPDGGAAQQARERAEPLRQVWVPRIECGTVRQAAGAGNVKVPRSTRGRRLGVQVHLLSVG